MLSYVLSAWPRVTWRSQRKRYDIVHCHFVIPTGLLAYLATACNNTPYVLTAHGSDIPGYNPDRFKKEHLFTVPLLRRILRRAAWVTAPSQYLRDLMIQACGHFPIQHIPNGIDLTRFSVRPKQRRILMTGRLLPRKGFQHVLAALDGLDTDYEVHIAGDGPLRSALEQQADKLKIKVVFHGWVDINSAKLRDLYETSAVFCLPSKRENASISLLEAMLAGMAVITSDVTGCPETVGDAGLMVPPGDIEAIRAALARLLRSPEIQADYGCKARRRVEQFFDWEKIGGQYIECFERVTAERAKLGGD
jgi:glycosyltransferase involved in cell wall biosynthesis